MTQVCNYIIFRNKLSTFGRMWDTEPHHSKNVRAEMHCLYRRTRLLACEDTGSASSALYRVYTFFYIGLPPSFSLYDSFRHVTSSRQR